MCSIEAVRPSSHAATAATTEPANRVLSLKLIEKRLNHLRQELRNLTKKEVISSTPSYDQHSEHNDEHCVQYKKRLYHLLRSHDKQVTNLNHWRFCRSHAIEQMYAHEIHQSDEMFQTKKIEFKLKLLSTCADKRRHLDYEHQTVSIRHGHHSEQDAYMLSGMANPLNDSNLADGHNHYSTDPVQQQQQQQQQRPTYNLRRAAATDLITDTASTSTSTSLKDLSIFSGTTSLLPLSSGIELQRCLSSFDIEQDMKDVRRSLKSMEPMMVDRRPVENDNRMDHSTGKSPIDVRIEEGRLWYQRAWFSRNSPILLVFDDLEIVPALVLTVGRNDLLIRRSGTNIKHRVSLALLHDGHLAIRKRGCIF